MSITASLNELNKPQVLLDKIKTVMGAGSGLDADNNTLSFKEFRTAEQLLADAKSAKKSELQSKFNADEKSISDTLPHEMVSWRKQETEARAYKADNSVDTPFLSALIFSIGMGETVEDIAVKIADNADAYELAYATLLGKYQSLVKQVAVAITVDDVKSIVW